MQCDRPYFFQKTDFDHVKNVGSTLILNILGKLEIFLVYISDNSGIEEPCFPIVVNKETMLKREVFYTLPSGAGIRLCTPLIIKDEKLFQSK